MIASAVKTKDLKFIHYCIIHNGQMSFVVLFKKNMCDIFIKMKGVIQHSTLQQTQAHINFELLNVFINVSCALFCFVSVN